VICPEKKRLTDELGAVIKRILELHSRESDAVIAGDVSDRSGLAAELAEAQSRRSDLRAELRQHTAGHGC
jgi:hypothetical protein